MPKLPIISGDKLVRILIQKRGFRFKCQKGSHVILTHDSLHPITIPLHSEIKVGLLNDILKTVNLTRRELMSK